MPSPSGTTSSASVHARHSALSAARIRPHAACTRPAECPFRTLDQRVRTVGTGKIGRNSESAITQFRRQRIECLAPGPRQHHARARTMQSASDGAANAAARPGDQRALTR